MKLFKKLLTLIIFNAIMVQISSAQSTPPGNALNFSSGSRVTVSSLNISPAVYPNLMISVWANRTIPFTTYGAIVTNDDGGFDRGIDILSDNNYHIFAGRDINTGIPSIMNSWEYVSVYWSSSAVKMYKNGVLVFTTSAEDASTSATGTTIAITGNSSLPFTGRIDELSIWSRELSASEVLTNMTSTINTATAAGLLAYYNFDASSGTTLTDQTSNGRNGTLSSSPSPTWVESYAMVLPTANAASNVNGSSFTANWSAPVTGMVDNGYRLDVSTSPIFASAITGSPFTVAGTSQSVTGLTTTTTYYYRVRADKTSVTGQGGYSATVTTTTLGVVALRLVNFTAYVQGKNVNTEWSVSDPLNGRSYLVLRSDDGRDFKEVGTLIGTASSIYNFTDKQPLNGNSYYRLKAISITGSELLSNIVKININNTDQKIVVFPNPVSDGHFTVSLNNAKEGEYKISILTNNGGEVYTKTFTNTAAGLQQNITLNKYFVKGIYLMKITSPDKSERSQTLIIE